jgi:hypothetical protein
VKLAHRAVAILADVASVEIAGRLPCSGRRLSSSSSVLAVVEQDNCSETHEV